MHSSGETYKPSSSNRMRVESRGSVEAVGGREAQRAPASKKKGRGEEGKPKITMRSSARSSNAHKRGSANSSRDEEGFATRESLGQRGCGAGKYEVAGVSSHSRNTEDRQAWDAFWGSRMTAT